MSSAVLDKVYIITGSASGMGLATAQTLLQRGAKIAACDINEKNLEEFYNSLEAAKKKVTLTGSVDLRNKGDLREFAQQARSHFGRLHGVANFAGTGDHEFGTESKDT
ncbi:hypothetical protein HFD88_000527 [Aspergillus terreus]|nr:hypothetical protein HFD88_000527 [Aspergillus terreus]